MMQKSLRKPDMLLDGETSIHKEPYQQLDGDDSFRILILHPGSRHEPLSGTLLQQPQLGQIATYDALSYRWSDIDADNPALIQIGNVSFSIGPNLHAALLQFRQVQMPRCVWVDQICIDQSHQGEKAQQLKIMADIYSKARTVLVWLGTACDQSDVAMEFFPIFVEQIRRNDEVARTQNSTQVPSDIIEKGGTLAMALDHLFERPWFGRVWTLQEAALATRAEIWCGSKSFDFRIMETFAKGCDNDRYGHWLTGLELIGPKLSSSDPENPLRPHTAQIHLINKLKEGTSRSASILNSVRLLECSRDEDRIYSMVRFLDAGLVDEITTEYKPSVDELYHRAAIYGIHCGELDYLSAAGLSQHSVSYPTRELSSNEPFLSLPSWVPDWTYKIRTHGYWVHNRVHEAENGTPLFVAGGPAGPAQEWNFSDDRSTLSATGIIIDRVEDCTSPFHILRIPKGLAEGSMEDKLNIIHKAQTELQSYIVSCMKLATECTPNYGSTNVGKACRQSLVGGMMPKGTTTTRGVITRTTDEAVDSLFENYETMVWTFKEGKSLATLTQTSMKAENFEWTDEIKARFARLASAREKLSDLSKVNNLQQAMADACKGRRFFITDRHRYMGVAPDLTEPGDKICVLHGCCAPFVIRPKGTAYQLIGECFVAGIMDGEIMQSKGHLSETIWLV